MGKYMLHFSDKTIAFEKQEQWYNASLEQFHLWKSKPEDLNYAICAILECWYSLMELDYLEINPFDTQKLAHISCSLEKMLEEVTRNADAVHLTNPVYKAYTGYAFTISPLFWGAYEAIEEEGNNRIRSAFYEEPDCALFEMLYYGSFSDKTDLFRIAQGKFRKEVSQLEWGNSSVQEHLWGVFV